MPPKICVFNLRGVCRFGRRCWFSHDRPSFCDSTNVDILADVSNEASQSSSIQTMSSMFCTTPQPECQVAPCTNQKATLEKKEDAQKSKEITVIVTSRQRLHEQTDIENQTAWDETLQSAVINDLQCSICYELFIKPTVLNCSHTFCETCIHIWTKRVRKCPICRMHIKSKSFCLTLDNFIKQIVEFLPKDVKDKRELSIQERNKTKVDRGNQRNHLNRFESIQSLNYFEDNQDEDIDADIIVEESEMFRMNLHDTVVNTGGVNPLMRYMVPREQWRRQRRGLRGHNTLRND